MTGYDWTDHEIIGMVIREHIPEESEFAPAGTVSIVCRRCQAAWPCPTRVSERAYTASRWAECAALPEPTRAQVRTDADGDVWVSRDGGQWHLLDGVGHDREELEDRWGPTRVGWPEDNPEPDAK